MYLGQALRIKASGNAYPVPLMISVLYPIMAMVKKKIPKQLPFEASLKGRDAVAKIFRHGCKNLRTKRLRRRPTKKDGNEKHEGHEDEEASWEANQDYYEEKKGKSTKTNTGSKVKKTQAKTTRVSRRRARYQYQFLSSSSSN